MPFGLKAFASTEPRRLELPEISENATAPLTLLIRHVDVRTARFQNWRFKRSEGERAADGTLERLLQDRAWMRDCIAEVAMVGWENVLEDGAAVECTPDAATRFLDELIEVRLDIFTKVSSFAMATTTPETSTPPPVDGADLGKE